MAGTIGAIRIRSIPPCLRGQFQQNIIRPPPPFGIVTKSLNYFPHPFSHIYFLFSSVSYSSNQMEIHNTSLEISEPSPKIQKLIMNQNAQPQSHQSSNIVPYFRVKKLSENAVLPSKGSPLSAGYDLSSSQDTTVPARGKALIPTDLSVAVPEGTYARIAPRSGLAWKHSIDVGAGVIDADYRGPVGIILFNHSDVDFEVKAGDRIAQLIIQKIVTPHVTEVDDLDVTVRGAGGFGSTGV